MPSHRAGCLHTPRGVRTQLSQPQQTRTTAMRARCTAEDRDNKDAKPVEQPRTGLGLKAAWVGAEAFGDLLSRTKQKATPEARTQTLKQRLSREEAVASIRRDYDEDYFISGRGEMAAYDPECLFADPFAGFKGVERFKKNVSNLGGLCDDVNINMVDWIESEDQIKTRWRFSAVLQLPWRPLLAAAGSTTHVFDKDTGLVVKHLEEWEAEPGKVLRRLVKPSSRMPSNQWEVFMGALDQGDVTAMWLATSSLTLKLSGAIVAVSLLTKLATGEGLPGVFLGTVEGISYLLLLASGITQAAKMVSPNI